MNTPAVKTPLWKTENFKRRSASSLVIFLLSIGAILGGVVPFGFLLIVLILACTWEWGKITGDKSYQGVALAIILAILYGLIFNPAALPRIYGLITAAGLANVFIMKIAGMVLKKDWQRYYYLCAVAPLTAFGFIQTQLGGVATLLFLSCIWLSDIGAYLVGKKFGKNKLCPSISPGKTWEGAIGAFVLTTVYASYIAYIGLSGQTVHMIDKHVTVHHPILLIILYAAVFAVLIQAGDLLESAIKRRFNVKDSSNLIPGHGGVLDRVDGFILALPFLALIIVLVQLA